LDSKIIEHLYSKQREASTSKGPQEGVSGQSRIGVHQISVNDVVDGLKEKQDNSAANEAESDN